MKYSSFRRSTAIEDYRDPERPVEKDDLSGFFQSLNEMRKITNSTIADDLGGDDIKAST
jgi:hypothetical protein